MTQTVYRCSIVLAASLLPLAGVEAQHCSTSYRSTVVKKDVVVAEKVVVPVVNKFVAVIPLVEYPTYAAVYAPPVVAPAYGHPYGYAPPAVQPPVAPAAQSGASAELKAVLDALKSFDDRLKKLEAKESKPADPFNPQPLKQQPAQQSQAGGAANDKAARAAAVVGLKCIQCHDAGNAADKGGGFVMVDREGFLAPASAAQAGKVVRRVEKGDMPPPDSKITMSQADKDALVAFYAGR